DAHGAGVGSGYLLLVGHEADVFGEQVKVPWGFFLSEAAARQVAQSLSAVDLIVGYSGEVEAGDTFTLQLVQLRRGHRFATTDWLRVAEVTAEDLGAAQLGGGSSQP